MKAWYRQIDYTLILLWGALVGVGLVAIYSTTHGLASEFLLDSVKRNFERQLVWTGICALVLCVALMLPVRFYQKVAYPFYGLMIVLLVVALVAGNEVNGARSWLRVGPVQFQVSELAKVGTLMAVAQLLASRRPYISDFRHAGLAVLLVLVPALLIVMQNDAGTALVFFAVIPFILFWSGLPISTLLLMAAPALTGYLAIVYWPAALGFSLLLAFGFYLVKRQERYLALLAVLINLGTVGALQLALTHLLRPHHVARILSFTNPEAQEYRYTIGFHLVQSKAAIGSGGVFGKGFMEGTQTQGAYVPEQTTDFIFSVIGEEFGFVGALLVLVLFALLLIRLVLVGAQIKHPFGSTLAAGVAGLFLIHVFLNIGMTTGILPVIGIPLPFISYGGSALLAETALLGLVLSLHMRQDDFSIYGY